MSGLVADITPAYAAAGVEEGWRPRSELECSESENGGGDRVQLEMPEFLTDSISHS